MYRRDKLAFCPLFSKEENGEFLVTKYFSIITRQKIQKTEESFLKENWRKLLAG